MHVVPLAIVVKMHVHVDQERCQGHNRCVALAPDHFEVDDYGTAQAKDAGVVPPGREGTAQLAVANCPEYAITSTED
jgi:ferredoxin